MSKPWPDEVRSMVDALTRDGVLSQVTPLSATTWRVSVPYADADCGPGSMPWTCNGQRYSYRERDAVRAELTRVAMLAPRIHAAAPDARVTTTTDGIEVTVGSKSVRWKRERRGWSLGDDLFTSDERVIEHAKGMALASELSERLKAKGLAKGMALASELSERLKAKGLATSVVRNLDTGVVTVSAKDTLGCWHSAELRGGRWHYSGVEIATTAEAYRVLLEVAAPPKPAPPSLLERLREAVPGLEWERDGNELRGKNATGYTAVFVGRTLLCYERGEHDPHAVRTERPSDDECVRIVTEWYAKTHPAPAAPQPSPRALDTDAALRAAAEPTEAQQRRLSALAETAKASARDAAWREMAAAITSAGLQYDAYGDYLEVLATSASCWRMGITSDGLWQITSDEKLPTTEAAAKVIAWAKGKQATEQRDRTVTVTVNGNVLDTEALTRAIDEQSRREKAHAAKGPTTMSTLDQAKVDASEAALRTAAKQLAKAARDPLAGAVARHLAPGDDSMRARVAAMLETEAGLAMLKAVLSLALGAIPQAGARGAALAHELRVQAMADGADLALDVIAGPLREVVALYLQDPAGAPAAAPALDAPQTKSVEWTTAEQKVAT